LSAKFLVGREKHSTVIKPKGNNFGFWGGREVTHNEVVLSQKRGRN